MGTELTTVVELIQRKDNEALPEAMVRLANLESAALFASLFDFIDASADHWGELEMPDIDAHGNPGVADVVQAIRDQDMNLMIDCAGEEPTVAVARLLAVAAALHTPSVTWRDITAASVARGEWGPKPHLAGVITAGDIVAELEAAEAAEVAQKDGLDVLMSAFAPEPVPTVGGQQVVATLEAGKRKGSVVLAISNTDMHNPATLAAPRFGEALGAEDFDGDYFEFAGMRVFSDLPDDNFEETMVGYSGTDFSVLQPGQSFRMTIDLTKHYRFGFGELHVRYSAEHPIGLASGTDVRQLVESNPLTISVPEPGRFKRLLGLARKSEPCEI